MTLATATFVRPMIDVSEDGDRRRVRTLCPQHGHYPYDDFLSEWPADLLIDLAELKGEWFADAYARFEEPNYTQKQVDLTLALYGLSLTGRRTLDFGCGFGASSYCLIKRGADNIVAADLEHENIEFARRFFNRRGLAHNVDLREENIVDHLGSAEYDLIWLQAVVEHLLPAERSQYLPRFWEALRPGGVLVINETPNRLWPKETHTTGGRWWIPWMAPHRAFSILRRDPRYKDYTDVDFYRSGVIGSSYSEVLDCLGRPNNCEELSRNVRSYLDVVYRFATVKRPSRSAMVRAFGFAAPILRLLFRQPAHTLLPYLGHLAFRKKIG